MAVELVLRAQTVARIAHYRQVDKSGDPYIYHPARVADRVKADGFGPEVIAAAFLHDVVEDTPMTVEDIRAEFGDVIAAAVDCLTHRKGEPRTDYYFRVRRNRIATIVKWYDVADNADPARLARLDKDTRERLQAKYAKAIKDLGVPSWVLQRDKPA